MKKILILIFITIISISCTKQEILETPPTVITLEASDIKTNSFIIYGEVINEGFNAAKERGFVWNTSNTYPSVSDNKVVIGYGKGQFSSTLEKLQANTTYYVKAFATNDKGTSYGDLKTIKTTDYSVPVVTTKSGRIWMDRNLGASQVATSLIDQKAYGDLYQWGRKTDGHQLRNSKISSIRLSNNSVSSPDFIISSISQGNWLESNNDNLWQLLNDNNVCPNGFRIPTKDEWLLEMSYWNSKDAKGAFESALKLPISGARSFADGGIYGVGESGFYWSSTTAGNNLANDMIIGTGTAYININPRGDGFAVRCIKD